MKTISQLSKEITKCRLAIIELDNAMLHICDAQEKFIIHKALLLKDCADSIIKVRSEIKKELDNHITEIDKKIRDSWIDVNF